MAKNLLIIANAFVSSKSIGGGDRFIMDVAPAITKRAHTSIILPEVGYTHWRKKVLAKATYVVLPSTIFDNRDNPLAIGIAYLLRAMQALPLLKKAKPQTLLTNSHAPSDILPAYLYKLKNPQVRWVARLYHLIPPPRERAGNPLRNLAALAEPRPTDQKELFLNNSEQPIEIEQN